MATQSIEHGPELGRIRDVIACYPVSRSWLYKAAADGNVRMLKLGGRTLVDLSSLRAFLSRLPAAPIRPTAKSA